MAAAPLKTVRPRRARSAVPATLIGALALVIAAPLAASAAGPSVEDDAVRFTWGDPVLTSDANGNGRPDVGDQVSYPFSLTVLPDQGGYLISTATVDSGFGRATAGTHGTYASSLSGTAVATVTQGMLDALGGGPYVSGAHIVYTDEANTPWSLDVAAPPALYTAAAPVTATSSLDLVEHFGRLAGLAVEGDQVRYVTHVTNTSGADVVLTGTGWSSPTLPVTVPAGGSVDLTGPFATATLAHMQAGSVAPAAPTLAWSVGVLSGVLSVSAHATPTEPIDMSVVVPISTTVHDASTKAVLGLDQAKVGDRIDYTYSFRNVGNVNLANYMFSIVTPTDPAAGGYPSVQYNGFRTDPGAVMGPGQVLPEMYFSSNEHWLRGYLITQADLDRGYVDLSFEYQAAPSSVNLASLPESSKHRVSVRAFLHQFSAQATLDARATLNDANGDGIGQEGETVAYAYDLVNTSDQPITVGTLDETPGSDIQAVDPAVAGATFGPTAGPSAAGTYTITAADVARGFIDFGVTGTFTGSVDGASGVVVDGAPRIVTGAYVAPASTFDASATYVDANADGHPSIGETVTVTVNVANTGAYPLTGIAVSDGAATDVTGLLHTFPFFLAPGASAPQSFTYVLSAEDYARGSFTYAALLTADGLPMPGSQASVSLGGVTFQAYATDLDGVKEGGVEVCAADGTPTSTIVRLTSVSVKPGSCSFLRAGAGFRVVAFSAPLQLAADTFTVVVPTSLSLGEHRLALYAPDGSLVGWKAVTVKDPIAFSGPGAGGLAATGADARTLSGAAGGAAVLVLLGTVALVASRRRRGGAER